MADEVAQDARNRRSARRTAQPSPSFSLPEGWAVQLKVRKGGLQEGTPYKCYKHIQSGRLFRSTKEVESYMKSSVQSKPSFSLPEGWVVEVRFRKDGPHKGKAYKCYKHPVTGKFFRSKKEVSRYLETGELPKRSGSKNKPHSPVDSTPDNAKQTLPVNSASCQKVSLGTTGTQCGREPHLQSSSSQMRSFICGGGADRPKPPPGRRYKMVAVRRRFGRKILNGVKADGGSSDRPIYVSESSNDTA